MAWRRYGNLIGFWAVVVAAVLVGLKLTVLAPHRVEPTALTTRDLQREVFGVGTVEAKVVVNVGSKITNRVTALHVDQGDRVRTGQLLATLESQEFREQVSQGEHDLARVEAEIVANQAAIRRAEADLRLARTNYERYRALLEEEVVARLDFERKENEYIAAQEAVHAVRAQQVALEKQQKKARANVGFTKARLADTVITAPFDGVIVSREAEVGDVVVAGAALFRLADTTSPMWVRAHIDETVAGDIRVGQPARVILRSQPRQSLTGTVARVEVESDRVTEEKAVNVIFSFPFDLPPLGEQAEVYIITARKEQGLALPRQSVVSAGRMPGVWLIQDGRVRWREVQLGIVDPDGWVEIVAGITPEDRIANAPLTVLQRLTHNARVTVEKEAL
jgi:HlyD family secretion protein